MRGERRASREPAAGALAGALPCVPRVPSLTHLPLLPLAGLLAASLAFPPVTGAQDVENGERLYERWCAECHGAEGEGDGPAASRMLPRPRDFTEARYQIRTTASGNLPTTGDIMSAIEHGLPGTTMPGWPNLNRSQRRDLTAYLKSLSPFFQRLGPPDSLSFESSPGGGEEALESGRQVYTKLECDRCHGSAGRGDGPSAPTLTDWRDQPIRAADLTQPWLFNGGSSVEEIHRRFLTGLDGTPMPTQSDALNAGVVDSSQLWDLAYYVRSLAPERVPPGGRNVVRVERIGDDGELPAGPGSDAWEDVERYWFPLAGQVIEQPRQFEPMVDGVWVEGLHDGDEIALRVSWNDPSQSPDSAWMQWQRRVADALDADGTPWPTDSLPDRLAVQFPTEIPEGRERPYFLMGSAQKPVYLWRWNSREGTHESTATGLGTAGPLAESRLQGEATWSEGQWRVVFRRSLEGEGQRITLESGVAVPMAFYAWDGNNAETGSRAAVSSWYFMVLEVPTGTEVYVAPAAVVLLVAGFGVFMARSAREGEAEGGTGGDGGAA